MRYSGPLLAACALIAAWQFISNRPISWSAGTLVKSAPEQEDLASAVPIAFKGVTLLPRAHFKAEVRVLSRSHYWLGKLADIAPLDIAVGWGQMSDSAVLKSLDISQSGRFYFWHYDDELPIPRAAIETQSANWHLVPADSTTWSTLRGLRVGDIVALEGELVDVESPELGTLSTSLRRDDTGAGACEIVFVQVAHRRYH